VLNCIYHYAIVNNSVTVTMIKFVQWAKSGLLEQIFAILFANLFRQLLLHCMTFHIRGVSNPQNRGRRRPSLLLPLGAENQSYATGQVSGGGMGECLVTRVTTSARPLPNSWTLPTNTSTTTTRTRWMCVRALRVQLNITHAPPAPPGARSALRVNTRVDQRSPRL